jgi:hypothetical protein
MTPVELIAVYNFGAPVRLIPIRKVARYPVTPTRKNSFVANANGWAVLDYLKVLTHFDVRTFGPRRPGRNRDRERAFRTHAHKIATIILEALLQSQSPILSNRR